VQSSSEIKPEATSATQEMRWEEERELRPGEWQLLARARPGSHSTQKLMACEQISAVITCGGR